MPRTTTNRPATPHPRRRRAATPAMSASLFDSFDSPDDDAPLLADLEALVALGLLERRSAPEGVIFALTELGSATESD